MKNKKIKKLYVAIVLLLVVPEIAKAGGGGVIASTAFNAVNKVSVTQPATVVDQSATTTAVNTNFSAFTVKKASDMDMQSTTTATGIKGNTVALYPYRLYLTYAVPMYVYYDWQYVRNGSLNLLANNYAYANNSNQNRLMNLAYNDFTCYSNYPGIQQTLEFRAGTGITFQYGGAYPPVMPNYNPILSTKTFSAP